VQAVYWRFSDHVVLGRPVDRSTPVVEPIRVLPVLKQEPLLEDEVAAFKRALAMGAVPLPKPRAVSQTGQGLLLTGYEDTEMAEEAASLPTLSPTQYGDLPLR
jgi:hypothetical protein